METLVEYLSTRGSRADLAGAIGVNPQLLSQWIHGVRQVPAARCPAIEAATGGLVRCEDLRPDVPWHVLRQNTQLPSAKRSRAAIKTEAKEAR